MRLRATWPLPVAAVLILVALFYALGPLVAQIIALMLIVAAGVLVGWALAPRPAGVKAAPPRN